MPRHRKLTRKRLIEEITLAHIGAEEDGTLVLVHRTLPGDHMIGKGCWCEPVICDPERYTITEMVALFEATNRVH